MRSSKESLWESKYRFEWASNERLRAENVQLQGRIDRMQDAYRLLQCDLNVERTKRIGAEGHARALDAQLDTALVRADAAEDELDELKKTRQPVTVDGTIYDVGGGKVDFTVDLDSHSYPLKGARYRLTPL